MITELEYKKAISEIINVNADNIFLYWKGRVALFAILKALELNPGDEVVLPGFTCVVVPNAIKYLGLKPVYVDIQKDSLCPSIEAIKNAITPKTKVIICQNTFGLSYQVDLIADFGRKSNIFTIEDCAHGFGGTFKKKPNGTFCDAAFFSTQWNKPFSTGLGGFSIINNDKLKYKIEKVNLLSSYPSFIERNILYLLLISRNYLLTEKTYWQLRSIYRWMSMHHLVVGSSQGIEIESTQIPDGYFKKISNVQVREGIRNIKNLDVLLKKRIENARKYTDFLILHDKYHVIPEYHQNHSFLKYPILVRDRLLFEQNARKARIELGDWFCSPIHPVTKGFDLWDVELNKIPISTEISKQIVNIPTDTEKVDYIISFIKENLDSVI